MMKAFLNLIILLFVIIQPAFSFETAAKQAFLMDFETSEVLFEKNADEKAFPSSMTKIMTSYLIFEKLENGEVSFYDKVKISGDAWKQEGSRMFLNIGSLVTIDELLTGLIVQSGNDAAYSLAEGCGGSIENFVEKMNAKAKEFDMRNTNFTNPIGFSDGEHYMSVRDTAILSQKLILKFPEYYSKYFPVTEYRYNNILQANRNLLLKKCEGVDGIKTGHTEAGGYSLSSSALRGDRRLIAVVNGLNSEKERAEESAKLLDYGFNNLILYKIYGKDEIIDTLPIKYGKKATVNIIVKDNIYGTAQNKEEIKTKINIEKDLKAPFYKDEKIGTLIISTNINERKYNLYVKDSIEEVNLFKKIFLSVYYFFKSFLND